MAGSSLLLPDAAHATITRVLRAAFPHPEFPDAPHERTATAILDAVAQGRRLQGQFAQGLRDLDAGSTPFVELDDVAAFTTLEAMASTAFFQSIRGSAIIGLYDDREVWGLLG